MPVLSKIRTLYQCRAEGGQAAVHPIDDAALAWAGDRITWVGRRRELPTELHGETVWDAGGGIVVPGLVDCHTHLAFGGWRYDEFERRILGASYLEIARAGGGIRSTVARTREAATPWLIERCLGHLNEMGKLGVTTVEAKSGYGLSLDQELRLLEVYRSVARRAPQRLVATLLGAHVVPPEYQGRRSDYVRLVAEEMVPAAAERGLASHCDVFVEESAFSIEEARQILEAGQRYGLGAKLHADQLSAGGGAELAAAIGAVSADHLERISEAGIVAMAEAGVVAVSLPLASLYLQQPALPARRLLEAGVAVAVATDFNPGSAPSFHLPLAMTLAATLQRMTPAEVLKGATQVAARAIRLEAEVGSLEVGKRADFAVLDAESVEHWLYHFTASACRVAVCEGRALERGTVS